MIIIVNIQEYRIMIIIVHIQEYRIKVVIVSKLIYRMQICNSERDQGIPALACLTNDRDLDQLANSQSDQRLCRSLSRNNKTSLKKSSCTS